MPFVRRNYRHVIRCPHRGDFEAGVVKMTVTDVFGLFSLSRRENAALAVRGRHDPCIAPRAVPVVEAAAAIAIFDAILSQDTSYRRVITHGIE